MRGPFFMSLGLHALLAVLMIWATGEGKGRKLELPAATVVKLIQPGSLQPLVPLPGKESATPEKSPALEIPLPRKEKAQKPIPDKEKQVIKKEVSSPKAGSSKGELVGSAGTLRVGSGGFEYDFYLSVVQSKIEQNFRPPPGVRGQSLATVAFVIQRSGQITDVTLARSSGNLLIDQAAERAIRAAGRFPPLPSQYEKDRLEIYFEFVVNPVALR